MTRPRTDGNQGEIVAALIAAGASVAITTGVKDGFPDTAVAFQGINYLAEIKTAKGKLTDDQRKFIETWQGPVYILRTKEDALRMIGR